MLQLKIPSFLRMTSFGNKIEL